MIDETSRYQLESIKENARINSSIEKLRIRLRNFIVIDRQGQLIGEVKDLILEPNRQINFVVAQSYSDQSPRLVLLISKLVQKVDPSNQSVIVDINKAEIEYFPEYVTRETPGMETSDISDSSRTSAYKAVDEDTSEDSGVYSVATPAADVDVFNLDLDDTLTSDVASADVQDQDIMSESDVYPIATPAEDADIFDLFNLDLDDTSMSDVASAGVQDQDIMPESDIYPVANAELFSLDLDDTLTSDVALAGVQDQSNEGTIKPTDTPEVLEEEIIRLLGERVIVERGKRKVGEVIVRKEIETRMVQVPVRREKLIVEQVSPERKQLAEIELGLEEISAIELNEWESTGTKLPETTNLGNELTVKSEFNSPKIASLLLNAIALERRQGCKKVRLEIVVEDVERQKTYQEWADRCSSGKPPNSSL